MTFAEAAAEWLRFIEEDRERKPSTLTDYRNVLRSRLLPAFGDHPLQEITPEEIEQWRCSLTGLSNRSKNKLLIQLHGVFRRAQTVWGSPRTRSRASRSTRCARAATFRFFARGDLGARPRRGLRARRGDLLDGSLHGELLALHWRDVDFAGATIRVRSSWAGGFLTTPKSGKVRAVPLAPDVATALAQPGRREYWTGDDDLVFASETGSYLDGSALRRRYKAAQDAAGLLSPVPRSPPHVRHTDDRQGRHPPRAGVDGPRRHSDHDEVPPLRAPRRGARLVAEAFALPESVEPERARS